MNNAKTTLLLGAMDKKCKKMIGFCDVLTLVCKIVLEQYVTALFQQSIPIYWINQHFITMIYVYTAS